MDNNKLKQLLEEIYALDGSLRARENELIKAIEGYMAIKDEVVPDETFKQNLLRDIRSRFPSSHSSVSAFPGFSIMNKLTSQEAHRLFFYNKDTGAMTRSVAVRGTSVGDVVGCADKKGYKRVFVSGKMYLVHRIAWLLYYGEWPEIIDHKDGDPSNNRITNLRNCTHSENLRNTKPRKNATGVKGVYWHISAKKYCVRVCVNKNRISFGLHDDLEFAELVACEARQKYHGEFARQK